MTAALPDGATVYRTREAHPDHYMHPGEWPAGLWDDEPDKVSWTDPATGRPCLIVRSQTGALCGYVAVDPGHPLHGVGRDDARVQELPAHGGITYASGCDHDRGEALGICHVPKPGAPDDVWWFGFDCGHAWDLQPALAALSPALAEYGTYKHVGYVRRECAELAAALVTS